MVVVIPDFLDLTFAVPIWHAKLEGSQFYLNNGYFERKHISKPIFCGKVHIFLPFIYFILFKIFLPHFSPQKYPDNCSLNAGEKNAIAVSRRFMSLPAVNCN